jgi:hypothetical protein
MHQLADSMQNITYFIHDRLDDWSQYFFDGKQTVKSHTSIPE